MDTLEEHVHASAPQKISIYLKSRNLKNWTASVLSTGTVSALQRRSKIETCEPHYRIPIWPRPPPAVPAFAYSSAGPPRPRDDPASIPYTPGPRPNGETGSGEKQAREANCLDENWPLHRQGSAVGESVSSAEANCTDCDVGAGVRQKDDRGWGI